MPIPATPRFVVVDDNDPVLTYSGAGWNANLVGGLDDIGTWGAPYLHTVHGTSKSGTASFQFNGSYIHALASFENADNETVPEWRCIVDGVQIANEDPPEYPENNWKICNSADMDLTESVHNFTLDIKASPKNSTFWIDWIAYVPSPGASLERASILLPAEDSAILYDAPWGPWDPYNMMGTARGGSSATVSFVGEPGLLSGPNPWISSSSPVGIGVSASWYGFIAEATTSTTGRGSYTVDGGSPTVFTWTGDKNYTSYGHLFFTTPDFEPGLHKLKVTFLGSSPNVSPLTLSHLIVKNGSFPSSTPTPSAAPSDFPAIQTDRIMKIFGGVLGGVVGLFLIGLTAGCFLWRRRERRRRADSSIKAQPFVASPGGATEPPISVVSGSNRHRSRGKHSMGETIPLYRDAQRHHDSGLRFQEIDDVPPNYTIS